MGVYFPNLKIPTRCEDCNELDHEYDFGCELMPCTRFDSYREQYALCPLKRIIRMQAGIEVPEHGDLKDARLIRDEFARLFNSHSSEIDGFSYNAAVIDIVAALTASPVIIPSNKEADT